MQVLEVGVQVAFVVAGLINLAPGVGVFSDGMLVRLYEVPVESVDLSLLLRHRAILLGVVGVLLIYAAFWPELRALAGVLGLGMVGHWWPSA